MPGGVAAGAGADAAEEQEQSAPGRAREPTQRPQVEEHPHCSAVLIYPSC